jgi:hypothetical protein
MESASLLPVFLIVWSCKTIRTIENCMGEMVIAKQSSIIKEIVRKYPDMPV